MAANIASKSSIPTSGVAPQTEKPALLTRMSIVADLVGQLGEPLRVAQVRLNKLGLATGVANAGDDPGAALSVTAQHQHLGAVAAKRRGDCRSDALRSRR